MRSDMATHLALGTRHKLKDSVSDAEATTMRQICDFGQVGLFVCNNGSHNAWGIDFAPS